MAAFGGDAILRSSVKSLPLVCFKADLNSHPRRGRSFFVDIAQDGIALPELDAEPLAAPGEFSPELTWGPSEYFEGRAPCAKIPRGRQFNPGSDDCELAAFLLHLSIVEERAGELTGVGRQDQQRYIARFNRGDETDVKARYSPRHLRGSPGLVGVADRRPHQKSGRRRPSSRSHPPDRVTPRKAYGWRLSHLAPGFNSSYLRQQPRHGASRWTTWKDKRSSTVPSKSPRRSATTGTCQTP